MAIALRNRWRRMQLGEEMRREVVPNNIILIGPTGVGKTEIARRLSQIANLPFLKVEATNSILFATAKSDKREINIQQEYEAGDQTHFQDIYGIKTFTPSLRELLLMNSIYYCQTQSQIVDIVNDQPNPTIFYKSLLELDNSNMVSMLSFDSRSMEFLLDDGFGEHFSARYPIFFKNKVRKGASDAYYYRNAIQNAYKNNQVRAVDIILNYMIKYQNNVSCSYLLVRILPQIIEMGIEVRELCDSKIF